jgi:cysteine desulfurase
VSDAVVTVDARGQRCPQPVIALARAVTQVPVGAVVELLADDEAARLDVPAWCAMRGHTLLDLPTEHTYRVRREH